MRRADYFFSLSATPGLVAQWSGMADQIRSRTWYVHIYIRTSNGVDEAVRSRIVGIVQPINIRRCGAPSDNKSFGIIIADTYFSCMNSEKYLY